jgi:hypothetical protein
MSYKSAADGITQRGRTKGRNLGDDGAKEGIESGKKVSKGIAGGIDQNKMEAVGRNLAKVAANGK